MKPAPRRAGAGAISHTRSAPFVGSNQKVAIVSPDLQKKTP
jgi:hypothetical protein